jgi:predicted phosphodiesterase
MTVRDCPRLVVLADLHGNLPALEAVVADAKAIAPELWIVAGDFLTRAPFSMESLALLQDLKAVLVRGNGEQYQLDFAADPLAWETNVQLGVLRWSHAAINASGLALIDGIATEMVVELPGTDPIHVLHASPGSLYRGLVPDSDPRVLRQYRAAGLWEDPAAPPALDRAVDGVGEKLLVCGHTHIQWQAQVGNKGLHVVNPGSAGFSINGDPRAHYAVLEWQPNGWRVHFRQVVYDQRQLKTAYHSSGLLEQGGAFARCWLYNAMSGQNVPWFFIRQFLAKVEEGMPRERAWALVVQSFPWNAYSGSI